MNRNTPEAMNRNILMQLFSNSERIDRVMLLSLCVKSMFSYFSIQKYFWNQWSIGLRLTRSLSNYSNAVTVTSITSTFMPHESHPRAIWPVRTHGAKLLWHRIEILAESDLAFYIDIFEDPRGIGRYICKLNDKRIEISNLMQKLWTCPQTVSRDLKHLKLHPS